MTVSRDNKKYEAFRKYLQNLIDDHRERTINVLPNYKRICNDNTMSDYKYYRWLNEFWLEGSINLEDLAYFECNYEFEKRRRMSETRKGRTHTEETKRKISESKLGERHPLYGKIFSDEHRRKISESLNGRILSEEHKMNISNSLMGKNHPNYGKSHTKETKIKFSRAKMGKNHPNYGKSHTKETKIKMRKSAIKRANDRCGQITPVYNPRACQIIELYGQVNDYKFIHAESSATAKQVNDKISRNNDDGTGECYIEGLHFWVDGYDPERNVVIEYDEKHHFDVNGELKKKDKDRQKLIEDYLGCEFIRIKQGSEEELDLESRL